MNHERFIADFKRMYVRCRPQDLPEKVAAYVEAHFFERLSTGERGKIQAGAVISECCKYFGVSHSRLKQPSREERIRLKRQITIYMLRKFTTLSNRSISLLFRRHRTTMIASVERIDDLIETDDQVRGDVERLIELLSAGKMVDEVTDNGEKDVVSEMGKKLVQHNSTGFE